MTNDTLIKGGRQLCGRGVGGEGKATERIEKQFELHNGGSRLRLFASVTSRDYEMSIKMAGREWGRGLRGRRRRRGGRLKLLKRGINELQSDKKAGFL